MFCKYCGATIPDGSTFCKACGAPVMKADTEPDAPVRPAPLEEPAANRKSAGPGSYDSYDRPSGGYDSYGGYDDPTVGRGAYGSHGERGGYDSYDKPSGGYDSYDKPSGGYDSYDKPSGGYDRYGDRGDYGSRGGYGAAASYKSVAPVPMVIAALLSLAATVLLGWFIYDYASLYPGDFGKGLKAIWDSELGHFYIMLGAFLFGFIFCLVSQRGSAAGLLSLPLIVMVGAKVYELYNLDWTFDRLADFEKVELIGAGVLVILVIVLAAVKGTGRLVVGIILTIAGIGAAVVLFIALNNSMPVQAPLGDVYLGEYLFKYRDFGGMLDMWKYFFPIWLFFLAYALVGVAFMVSGTKKKSYSSRY